MDWALVAWITLRLTQRNIERIKDSIFTLVRENPRWSVVIFAVVASVIVAWIYKHVRSLGKE